MAVFVVLLFVPIVMQHVVIRSNQINYEKKNKWALAFFFFFLTVLLMFRHESVGNDTRNYIRHFKNYASMGWSEMMRQGGEIGFSLFNKLMAVISKQPQFFVAVVAIAISAMIYPTYRRSCVDSSLTVSLFCAMTTFVMMFSGIRQMLAIGVGFLAYEMTRQKKLVLFLLCVGIAMTIHTSAIMLVVMYPIYHAKITKKWLIFVIPIIAAVFVLNRQIFSILTTILERFTDYEGVITQTGAYAMLILFAVFAVFSFVIPDESLMDEETIGLRNFLLFSLVLQMFAPLHTLAMRMNYYYIIFIPLLLPKIIECKSQRWQQVAVVARYVMVGFFSIYFFISITGAANLNVYPYHFFWESV